MSPDGGAEPCASNADCDDDVFCNGLETCAPGAAGADGSGCLAGADPCSSGERCDEASDRCVAGDCAEPDADGDGRDRIECGGDDCDDADGRRFPGNAEVCDADGHDEDCDPETYGDRDLDGDGFVDAACCNGDTCGTDCDDADRGVHPDVPDPCDTVDNDCDGTTDEGGVLYRDLDNDGRGDPGVSMTGSCMAGWVFNADDCDDARSETYRGAREMCDGLDNDCSSASDPGGPEPAEDMDGDGHSPVSAMCLGRGEVGALGSAFIKDDCDDGDASTYTGAVEVCDDGIDQDCDGIADNPMQRVCDDFDGDGHGDAGTLRTIHSCELPSGSVPMALCDDCDDGAAATFPGNREICDRVDNDCSSGGGPAIDEDVDGDGWAPSGATCAGAGEVGVPATALPKGDCADSDGSIHPGATERCDGVDSDCSGGGAASDEDSDGDGHAPLAATCLGFGEPGGGTSYPKDDCDDADAMVNPAMSELVCDGIDNDCSTLTNEISQTCSAGGYCQAGGRCLSGQTIAEISSGVGHVCARLANGTLLCWGSNGSGQLGDATFTDRLAPTAVPGLASVIQVGSGRFHTCALLADGAVECWGRNLEGQLGDDTSTTRNTPARVVGLARVLEVRSGGDHSCARLADGTVRCWGGNAYGQLGDGTTTIRRTPTAVTGLAGDAVGLALGRYHSCAVLSDGGAQCWGSNFSGSLGDGTTTQRTSATAVVGLSGAAAIAAGVSHTCARLTDGTVRCWGSGGRLGTGPSPSSPVPVSVTGVAGVTAISAGEDHTCALMDDGSIRCWGQNAEGQLGDGTTSDRSTPTLVVGTPGPTASVSAGGTHTCARSTTGSVWCWGRNANGQLGDGTGASGLSPVLALDPAVTGLGGGRDHRCVVRTDGRVMCWGANASGQLGNGSTANSPVPVPVVGLPRPAVEAIGGQSHACARLVDGSVVCWGNNVYGQLGDGTTTSRFTPSVVSGLAGVVELDAGDDQTCALLSTGSVRCWGRNDGGQLGDGTTTNRSSPVSVTGLSGVVEIGLGSRFSCARSSGGQVRCWGRNFNGNLGDGTVTDRSTPVLVSGLSGAVGIGVGESHACAVQADGTVSCWGYNANFQLGDSTSTDRSSPVAVIGLSGVVEVGAGDRHTCVRHSDDRVQCWGRPSEGQLGAPAAAQWPPSVVALAEAPVEVVTAYRHTCIRTTLGMVQCWGLNAAGQLGDGTLVNRSTPTTVWDL